MGLIWILQILSGGHFIVAVPISSKINRFQSLFPGFLLEAFRIEL